MKKHFSLKLISIKCLTIDWRLEFPFIPSVSSSCLTLPIKWLWLLSGSGQRKFQKPWFTKRFPFFTSDFISLDIYFINIYLSCCITITFSNYYLWWITLVCILMWLQKFHLKAITYSYKCAIIFCPPFKICCVYSPELNMFFCSQTEYAYYV